ncbi:MAG: hypothetical protein U0105_27815 [Candidatus Obscuribacterales bacterium]
MWLPIEFAAADAIILERGHALRHTNYEHWYYFDALERRIGDRMAGLIQSGSSVKKEWCARMRARSADVSEISTHRQPVLRSAYCQIADDRAHPL